MLELQVEQLKAACRDLTTELEKARENNGRLQDANANVVAERGVVAGKLGEIRAQHSQLQGEHAGLKGQFEELASQRSEAAQHLDELEVEHRYHLNISLSSQVDFAIWSPVKRLLFGCKPYFIARIRDQQPN